MNSNNLFGEVVEGLKGTVKQTVKQTVKTPLGILETGVKQATGSNVADKQAQQFQQQINQMKQDDTQSAEEQMAAIRRNLLQMMTPKAKPSDELPKYISGKPGAAKTIEDLEELQEKAKKKKDKLEDLPMSARKGMGTGEGGRGMTGQ